MKSISEANILMHPAIAKLKERCLMGSQVKKIKVLDRQLLFLAAFSPAASPFAALLVFSYCFCSFSFILINLYRYIIENMFSQNFQQ
ncbi:hypothetical protein [Mucilaginibacter sp.]|uniref:hypothetical protein n=1 Tax=Mucilaginibacter sp. TaxID=1882438 RepID=UPI002635BB52|nr:hypothetical protein [Mucilaginibacter sp.]